MGTHPWVAVPNPPEFRLLCSRLLGASRNSIGGVDETSTRSGRVFHPGADPPKGSVKISARRKLANLRGENFGSGTVDEMVRGLAPTDEQITPV